jgi:hypothetical protein
MILFSKDQITVWNFLFRFSKSDSNKIAIIGLVFLALLHEGINMFANQNFKSLSLEDVFLELLG